MMKNIQIPVDFSILNQEQVDNCRIIEGLCVGDTKSPKEVFILHSATSTPREFYLNFAKWLAEERSAHVILYDYTGFGASAVESLDKYDVDFLDWGLRDTSSVLDYVVETYPNARLHVIGHSIGGMFLQYARNAHKINTILNVASGPGYTHKTTMPYRLFVYVVWFLIGPLLNGIYGYVAASKLGVGADIPRNVFNQWRRWCLDQNFYQGELRNRLDPLVNKAANAKMVCFHITDDPIVNEHCYNVDRLYQNSNLTPEYKVIDPAEHGLKKMEHLGFFKKVSRDVWPLLIKEL